MKCDPTCFAAKENRGGDYCMATTYSKCGGKACPFYKTHEQVESDRRKASERLARLAALGTDERTESKS